MRRREFIAGLGGAAVLETVGWPRVGRAQQSARPVIGMVNAGSAETGGALYATAFRLGLSEFGFTDGQNLSIEYQWLGGRYDHLPALVADWVRRRVAVIATPGSATAALAAKAATSDIPIVFGIGDDPVGLRLVASFNRPGGNATGINFFANEAVPKRMGLLHELVPKVSRMAMLVNPDEFVTGTVEAARAQEAASAMGLSIDVLKASTNSEIEQAFATMVGEGIAALVVAGSGYFASRRVQLATLASRYGIAAAYANRAVVQVGGLMSYGTDLTQMFHQVGAYAGQILRGAKPADLPVVQSTRFEFAINLTTAKTLGIEIPPGLLAIADEVIE
jgi:putative ABC transport system substrate-binding protein